MRHRVVFCDFFLSRRLLTGHLQREVTEQMAAISRRGRMAMALLAIYLVCFTAGVNGGVSGTGMAGGATPAMALRGGADTATAVSVHFPGAGFEQPRSHHAMVSSADPADA